MNEEVYTKEIWVYYADCDRQKRLKPSALLKYFTESAGQQLVEKGVTYEVLQARKIAFFLSKVVFRIPGEPIRVDGYTCITLRTWATGSKGAYFTRDFEILDETGAQRVCGTSYWVVVNPETRSIQKPAAVELGIPFGKPEESFPETSRLRPKAPELSYSQEILYSMIDCNGHANNTVYADLAVNAVEEYSGTELFEFELHFLRETVQGDHVKLYREALCADSVLISASDGEKTFFLARMQFKKK